jgi:TPR repeat protein
MTQWREKIMKKLVLIFLGVVFGVQVGYGQAGKYDLLADIDSAIRETAVSEKKSLPEIKKLAKTGNLDAQFKLGEIYYKGIAVSRNYKKAAEFFMKGAQKNHSDSSVMVGVMYYFGLFFDRDFNQAFSYTKKAADLGNLFAQNNLGVMYEKGKGIAKNLDLAFELYSKAALKNNYAGLNSVGEFYERGLVVAQDYKTAITYYKKASDLYSDEAYLNLGNLYFDGRGVEPDYKRAFELFSEAAFLRNSQALKRLGDAYKFGFGVDKDETMANKFYQRAIKDFTNFSDDVSQNALGQMYLDGLGVLKNNEKAFELFYESAKSDNEDALYNLGFMYEMALIDDTFDANMFYEKASALGNLKATFRLGLAYYEGKRVEKNYDTAFKLFYKAAVLGNGDAQNYLAQMFYNGEHGTIDYGQAVKWYEAALKRHSVKNIENRLGDMYFTGGYDLEKNYAKAAFWYESVDQNEEYVQKRLGDMYYHGGNGLEKNYVKAAHFYEQIAKNDILIKRTLGDMFFAGGFGLSVDADKAAFYYDNDDNQYDIVVQKRLGEIYYEQELQTDGSQYPKAILHLKLAAGLGDLRSNFYLGKIYFSKGDSEQAKKYFEAVKSDKEAQYYIGLIEYNSQERNMREVFVWMDRSAKQGFKQAREFLENKKGEFGGSNY